MVEAVIAIEDRRFFEHPGVDPIRAVGALITNLRGDKPYLVGGSTLTQQIVKNTFLTPEKTMQSQAAGTVHGARARVAVHKDQILELYLNDVTLGQRGPFEITASPKPRASSSARMSATSRSPRRRRSPA